MSYLACSTLLNWPPRQAQSTARLAPAINTHPVMKMAIAIDISSPPRLSCAAAGVAWLSNTRNVPTPAASCASRAGIRATRDEDRLLFIRALAFSDRPAASPAGRLLARRYGVAVGAGGVACPLWPRPD